MGYDPEVILAGRDVNDFMHCFIALEATKEMQKNIKDVSTANILILGATFKEDVSDVRNSKVFEVYNELKKLGVTAEVYDPIADTEEVQNEYDVKLCDKIDKEKWDCIIVAVAHKVFKKMKAEDFKKIMKDDALLMDIKNIYNKDSINSQKINYWGF